MEPAEKPLQNSDEKALIDKFNAITLNKDDNIAQHFLEMSAFELDKAVNLFFEHSPDSQPNISTAASHTNSNSNSNMIFEQMSQFFSNNVNDNNLTAQINEYKQFYREKERKEYEFEYNNIVPGILKTGASVMKGIWNKIVPIAIRGETPGGEEFNYFINKALDKKKSFDFVNGGVFENIDYAHSKQRMLLIFIYLQNSTPEIQNLQKQLLLCPELIKYINDNFVALGLLKHKQEAISLVQKFQEIKDFPCFVLFRKNLYENPVIVDIIPIQENEKTNSFYLDKIKAGVITCSNLVQGEKKIKQSAMNQITLENQNRFFNYAGNQFFASHDEYADYNQYQNPISYTNTINPQTQRKLELDRMLKKQQEEEYKLAQKLAEEQQMKKQKEEEEKKMLEQIKMKEEEEKANFELQKQEELKQKKKKLKAEPDANEPDIFEVLFRLPNGTKISRRFYKNDEIENLYIFIETLETSPLKTSFDIIRTMPSLNLSDKRQLLIKEVFEDSSQETFHIRELD